MKFTPRVGPCLITVATLLACAATALTAEHPRLLISVDDLAYLRHRAGVAQAGAARPEWGAFGVDGAAYRTLRSHFAQPLGARPAAGELLGAAYVHLMEPKLSGGAALATVVAALRAPDWVIGDPLELIIAADWCWPALPDDVRQEFLLSAREQARALTPDVSPLDPRRFRERLVGAMLAVAIDETDDPSPSWKALRTTLLDGAREYFSVTFPVYVRWRGLTPTGPAGSSREELLTALGVEVASAVLERNAWDSPFEGIGRWMEHYLFAPAGHPALSHHFIRDEAGDAPRLPSLGWRELTPLTAHLIARRTRDAAALENARRVDQSIADAARVSPAWLWVSLAFPLPSEMPDLKKLPIARNLDGSVVFRGGDGPETTFVWIDAAQPLLRARQHLDAGHFLMYRGGRLAVGGGDDIALEATPSKSGLQRLGSATEPFDFDQYYLATIAHNCLVAWDVAWKQTCNGVAFVPVGGQRCPQPTCEDFATPLDKQARVTGTQKAYGHADGAAYLALDLTPAYEDRAIRAYSREFVFVLEHALIVIDRVTLTTSRSPATWVLNVPTRPQVDGRPLPGEARIAGESNEAGIWRVDDAQWLRWAERDGALWFRPLAPTPRRVRVVGGPARQIAVESGPFAGRGYVGGDPDGFERLIVPGERRTAENAWYRLGAPTRLGAEVGRSPHWGRVELEPDTLEASTVYISVLVTDAATGTKPPEASVERDGDRLRVQLALEAGRATLDVPAESGSGGVLSVRGRRSYEWALPQVVEPDAPLRPHPAATEAGSRK